MNEDCIVLHCHAHAWKHGYCWAHHQAWQRYLAALPVDADTPAPLPAAPARQWQVQGELWVDLGAAGVEVLDIHCTVPARSRKEALRLAKIEASPRRRAHWDSATVSCHEVHP